MADDSADFVALPARIQHAIDAAFDAATGQDSAGRDPVKPSPRKRRRLDEPELVTAGGFVTQGTSAVGGFMQDDAPAAGGFIVDDEHPPAAGGFIVDERQAAGGFTAVQMAPLEYIALELVPGALQALDLPPDDPDVLSIFQNAATGWGAAGSVTGVGRKDWRAVSAVLLFGRSEDDFPDIQPLTQDDEEMDDDDDVGEDEGDDYVDEDDDGSESDQPPPDDSDDDYGALKSKTKTRSKAKRGTAAPDSDDEPPQLTARQKRSARSTFALFFPDVPDDKLDAHRIRIKDIIRVANLLKEKITAEEIIEMLQEVSTTPDRSVGLDDFEQVLMLAQLV